MTKLFQSLMLVVWRLFPSLIFSMNGDDILGKWATEDGDSRVEVFKKDHLYSG